jgi:predicted GNAT superfamily acetyltransferase
MTRADYPGILAINAVGRPGVAALEEVELDRLASISNQHFVAIDNANRVVGYLLAFHREAPYECEKFRAFYTIEQRFIDVDQIAIAEHYRGTGLGRRLYGVIQSVATDQGIRSCAAM